MAFSDSKLGIVLTIVGALGSAVAFLTFMDNRKNKKIQDELLRVDKEIKLLELAYKRKRNSDLDLNKPQQTINL